VTIEDVATPTQSIRETSTMNSPLTTSPGDVAAIVHGDHSDPFSILGMHVVTVDGREAVAVRVFAPEARDVTVVDLTSPSTFYSLTRTDPKGFYEALLRFPQPFRYSLQVTDYRGNTWTTRDPYSFLPVLGEIDLHLHAEGNHWRAYEKLGSHPMSIDGVDGVHFAVWAPNAVRASVVGDFNQWDGRRHAMRVHPGFGVWEIFIPGVDEGEVYKYEVKTTEGDLRLKADPYAFRTELRPATASVTHRLGNHEWGDAEWIEVRQQVNPLEQPICIYEVHLGSWKRIPEDGNRPLTYRELAHQLADYVAWIGFTHVELLPIMEHPHDPSWGYQVTGYYAPTSRYGAPDDFAYFVDHLHQRGIGVIVDWVPAHFPKDDSGLRWFDGTALYEHLDPRQAEHPDWGTLIFNYGRPEVHNFLLANALFWCEQYHIDGLRVDAVASMLYLDYSRDPGGWLPNCHGGRENLEAVEFLQHLNHVVHDLHPGVLMIAEESTSWSGVSRPTHIGGLGFTLKWNMGWMNDFLRYLGKDPIHRRFHHHLITFSLVYAFTENFVLPLSHDEVVHEKRSLLDKMPGGAWQRFANLRLALGYMYGHPGKKLLFMGGEFGQWREWDEQRGLDWHLTREEPHLKMMRFVRDLNHLYREEAGLHEVDFSWNGFEWIDFQDTDASLISFLRRGKDPEDVLVFACNFTPVPRVGYRLGVPLPGFYREMLNSDSEVYGGSNMGNRGGVWAESIPWHAYEHSIPLLFPPLAVVVFKRVAGQQE